MSSNHIQDYFQASCVLRVVVQIKQKQGHSLGHIHRVQVELNLMTVASKLHDLSTCGNGCGFDVDSDTTRGGWRVGGGGSVGEKAVTSLPDRHFIHTPTSRPQFVT